MQLEVRDLNGGGSSSGEVCFKGRVGSTVNNALHVGQHSNGQYSKGPQGGRRIWLLVQDRCIPSSVNTSGIVCKGAALDFKPPQGPHSVVRHELPLPSTYMTQQ